MRHKLLLLCTISLLISSWPFLSYATTSPQTSLPDSATSTLNLTECVEVALSRNPEILISQSNISEKEELAQGARKDRYPTLSTYYQYKKDLDSIYPEEDFYVYGITLKQPVYVGNSIITAVELGDIDKKSALYSHQATVNTITLRTYEAYYSLLKAEKLENVAKQAVELLESHRKDTQAFYDAGLIPKNDLLASELQLAQGQQDLRRATNFTLLAKSALNILLQRPPAAPINITDNVIYTYRDLAWDNILQRAREQRSEIKQYELAIVISEKNKILAKAPFLPSVVFSASYSKLGDSLFAQTNSYGGQDEIKSAEALATWKFWSWGQMKNKLSAADRRIDKAKESLRQLQEYIILEARQAFLAADETQKNISVTEKAIERAEENHRIVQGRFHAQLATSTEVLDAQNLLTSARSNYFNALYDYNIALARLDYSTGTLGSTQ